MHLWTAWLFLSEKTANIDFAGDAIQPKVSIGVATLAYMSSKRPFRINSNERIGATVRHINRDRFVGLDEHVSISIRRAAVVSRTNLVPIHITFGINAIRVG